MCSSDLAARGLGVPEQERGRGVLAQGAREHLLEGEGSLGSSFLAARALDVVGLVQGPRALGPGRLLGEEATKAPPELRCLHRTEGDAARGMVQGSPLRR